MVKIDDELLRSPAAGGHAATPPRATVAKARPAHAPAPGRRPVGVSAQGLSMTACGHLRLVVDGDESRTQEIIASALDDFTTPLLLVFSGLGLPVPADAWTLVERAMQTTGAACPPHFDHQEIADAVELVGWRNLCLGELPAGGRRLFVRSYVTLAARRLRDMADDELVNAAAAAEPRLRVIAGGKR